MSFSFIHFLGIGIGLNAVICRDGRDWKMTYHSILYHGEASKGKNKG